MMKKRIGNDITFTWHIYRKDGDTQVPESFTGKEVEVKLISPLQRPVTIEDVSIATGVVTFTFRGKHQVTLGNYVAVLQENKGEDGMVTIDVVSAVTLVPHSYMEEDDDEGDVIETEAVELTSTISAGGGGGIEQQQADWAQTDDTAVDFIKNKPDLDLYCRKDATNVHTGGYDQYIKDFGESVGNVAIDAQALWVRLLYPNGELVSETRVGPGNIRIAKNGVTLNLNPAYFQALAEAIQSKANADDLASLVDGGAYNTQTKEIELTHGNTVLARIDARAFVKDGMVDSVVVSNGYIVITFNTDAGKETIRIPVTDIFDPSNYYDKDDVDGLLADKVDKIEGKGLSANDYTDSDKEKVSSITLPGETYAIYRNQWILDGNIATNSEGVLKIEATAFLTPTIVDGRLVLTRNRPNETPYFKVYSPFDGTLKLSFYQWDEEYDSFWEMELGYLRDYTERYRWLEPFYKSSDNTEVAIYVKAGWNTIHNDNYHNPLTIIGISLQRGILALNSVVTQRNMGLMSPGYLTQLLNKVDKVTGKGLSANDYTTADKEKLSDLPTATELAQELGGKANSADLAEVATSGSYNDLSDKPDLSSFITRSVDDLTNYYLKNETYTKTEVQQLIGTIQQFHYEIYPTLPQTGASNVLYLIGPTGTGTDKYEEYVYANNDFTKIGDTSIDLSGYVTTQALNTALADYVTSSALSTILAGKEDTANKKTTIVGNEGDDTYYPSTKAVADYINEAKKQMLRELYLSTDPRPDSNVNRLRYNDTGADIIRTAEWGERIVHKAGYYWLNGLGDITEDEMSKIYSKGGIINPRQNDSIGYYLTGDYPFRTNLNISQVNWNTQLQYQGTAQYNVVIRVINLGNNNPQYISGFRQFGGRTCKAIIPALEMHGINGTGSGNNTFYSVSFNKRFMYAMLKNIVIDCPVFKTAPLIMYKCLKYLVDNAANTSAITITVHATTYGYLTDSSALPAEHSGVVETPADIATVTDEELVGMKEWDETTKKYVYATKAEWQQIVTDATAKNISFASA